MYTVVSMCSLLLFSYLFVCEFDCIHWTSTLCGSDMYQVHFPSENSKAGRYGRCHVSSREWNRLSKIVKECDSNVYCSSLSFLKDWNIFISPYKAKSKFSVTLE